MKIKKYQNSGKIVNDANYQEKLAEFNDFKERLRQAYANYDWDTRDIYFHKSDSLGTEIAKYTLDKYKSPLSIGGWAGTFASGEPEDIAFLIDGNIREDGKDVTSWLKSYVNSEGFKRIKNNQSNWWKNQHPYRKLWFPLLENAFNKKINSYKDHITQKADNVKNFVLDGYSAMSFSHPATRQTFTFIDDMDKDMEFPFNFVQMHELDHLFNIPAISNQTINYEALKQNTNTEPGHDSRDVEKHADITGLKYLLFKENIYDVRGNEDATASHIKKLREKYPELRPLKQMNDEQAAWMVNNVASNTQKINEHNI